MFYKILTTKIYKNQRTNKGQPKINSDRPDDGTLSVNRAGQINMKIFENFLVEISRCLL